MGKKSDSWLISVINNYTIDLLRIVESLCYFRLAIWLGRNRKSVSNCRANREGGDELTSDIKKPYVQRMAPWFPQYIRISGRGEGSWARFVNSIWIIPGRHGACRSRLRVRFLEILAPGWSFPRRRSLHWSVSRGRHVAGCRCTFRIQRFRPSPGRIINSVRLASRCNSTSLDWYSFVRPSESLQPRDSRRGVSRDLGSIVISLTTWVLLIFFTGNCPSQGLFIALS